MPRRSERKAIACSRPIRGPSDKVFSKILLDQPGFSQKSAARQGPGDNGRLLLLIGVAPVEPAEVGILGPGGDATR